jgi:SAM-dependent methyltransferase
VQQARYDSEFFESLEDGTERSAEACVDLLVELFRPASVVDLGCGTGLWLAAFKSRGVSDLLGVDGSWVPRDRLAIPASQFREHDLRIPLDVDRRFDLALCLETAEHVPPDCASTLVDSLTRLAPVIVFSAAVPGQGGTGHVNEQWPTYWAGRFAEKGYRCFTGVRERIWDRKEIEVWYRQNMLCFVSPACSGDLAQRLHPANGDAPRLDVAHPDLLARIRSDQAGQVTYAARLENELRQAKGELRRTRGELGRTSEELQRIRASLPFRAYAMLRRTLAIPARFAGRASRSDRSGS